MLEEIKLEPMQGNQEPQAPVDCTGLVAVVEKHGASPPDQQSVMASLVEMPKLPKGGVMDRTKEPLMVACVHTLTKGVWEWAQFDVPKWRDVVGDALLDAGAEPEEWRWVTLYPVPKTATAEVSDHPKGK